MRIAGIAALGVDRVGGMGQAPGMARKLRTQYPGAIYHLMSRGDHREPGFLGDGDRSLLVCTLGQPCAKTDWQVHAYCLMRNHFHLAVETPRPNLVAGMKWLPGVYSKPFIIGHKECGRLFAGRYEALPMDGSGDGCLRTACDHVHLNPARAGLLGGKPPEAFACGQEKTGEFKSED